MDIRGEWVEAGGYCYGRLIANLDEETKLKLGGLSRRKGLQSNRLCKMRLYFESRQGWLQLTVENGLGPVSAEKIPFEIPIRRVAVT